MQLKCSREVMETPGKVVVQEKQAAFREKKRGGLSRKGGCGELL